MELVFDQELVFTDVEVLFLILDRLDLIVTMMFISCVFVGSLFLIYMLYSILKKFI